LIIIAEGEKVISVHHDATLFSLFSLLWIGRIAVPPMPNINRVFLPGSILTSHDGWCGHFF